MTKYLGVDRLRETLRERAEIFTNNIPANGFRYPSGIRAWHAPLEVDCLDEPWSSSADQDYEVSITIPRGTSKREAMQRIHYGCHGALTSIHHETVDAHARSLRRLSRGKNSSPSATTSLLKFRSDPTTWMPRSAVL